MSISTPLNVAAATDATLQALQADRDRLAAERQRLADPRFNVQWAEQQRKAVETQITEGGLERIKGE